MVAGIPSAMGDDSICLSTISVDAATLIKEATAKILLNIFNLILITSTHTILALLIYYVK